MENSFFEYRNDKGADSDSDSEFIDNSFADASFGLKKKNGTVFVAESDEYTEDDSEVDTKLPQDSSKSVVRRSIVDKCVVLSSDDDASKQGSIRRQSNSSTKLVLSSSDEEQGSPEIVPKKRPPLKQKSISKEQDESIIGRKTRKRMILLDSDADNSIVIEQDKHKKLLCMKETPLKIVSGQNRLGNDSEIDDEESTTGDDEQELESDEDKTTNGSPKHNRAESKSNRSSLKYNHANITESGNDSKDDNDESGNESDVYEPDEESDGEEIDEDKMVMSRATRMSIMGMIPKDNDSDDSDFIQSDDSHRKSGSSSINSLKDLPDVTIGTITQNIPTKDTQCTPKKPTNDPKTDEGVQEEQNLDTSKITCSPFSSPLKNISNRTIDYDPNETKNKDDKDTIVIDDPTENPSCVLKNKVLSNLVANKENYVRYDDDVTIIDREPEIIALSSDDEDEAQREKSPRVKKSPKPKVEKPEKVSNDIKQYLVPPSYPNQVVYVKKHVRENELTKLEALKEDLKNIRYLLEQMDVNTLPDRGAKVIERLTRLEAEVRRQGDKVASMLVEPDKPTAEDIARDGFDKDKGLSWDDIQKASNAVQPRMFGKQAMATHMAERHLILDRLRDLYESLASRPAESELATQPRGVNTKLMQHQLHALAWLKWRETQRPRAGILADDMGLGKTITMIALAVSDKETRIDDDDDDEDDPPVKGKLSRGGTLVVCPASLVQQWAGEVSHHCGSSTLSVCLHHGPARAQLPHRLATYDLVVTTYNILQRDNEKNGVLMRVAWRRAILDEAHIVRNHKSATSAAVSALKASRRWCLTGTPVQNKDLDLFALLKFLKCSPFDDLTMWKKWVDNKSLGGQERLNTVMRCILLRRTKVQLQQKGQLDCLPDRTAHEQQVTLTKAEMNVYQKVLVFSKTLFGQFLHQRAEKNSDGGPMAPGKDSEYAKMHKRMIALQGAKPVKSHEILVLLLRLRQVCCHCGLIAAMLDGDMEEAVDEDPAGKDLLAELNKLSLEDSRRKSKNEKEKEDDEPEVESTTAAEAIRSVLSPNNPVFNLDNHSSKIKAVMDCLEENVFANKGEKAVVVSQWTSVLRLVERGLGARRVRSVTLSGAVAVAARPPLVAALNDARSDVRVMLLSLCAGGVGLNLCGANHLLLLDPHWNPQLEQQAQDRVYRVGQTKHVHVYRFMCVDTVEQTIRKLQEAKLELADNVLTGARNNNASKLTIEDLKMLFNMGE